MRRFRILAVIVMTMVVLAACAASPQIIKFDKQNYDANLALAKETLKTWSFNSGFISCVGLADKIKFPINTAGEAKAILQSSQITLGIAELDEIAKKRGVWLDEDYDYGCTLGIKARTATLATIDILKLFPTIAPYITGIFP